jgi:hypothetical protein
MLLGSNEGVSENSYNNFNYNAEETLKLLKDDSSGTFLKKINSDIDAYLNIAFQQQNSGSTSKNTKELVEALENTRIMANRIWEDFHMKESGVLKVDLAFQSHF